MSNIKVCDVSPELVAALKKFRFRKSKTNAAISMKIDQKSMQVVVDEEFEDTPLDDIVEELPETTPRYFVYTYTYKHADGRMSYPMVFIYLSPNGVKPELHMLYAGSKTEVVKELKMTKTFELRNTSDLTEEWLNEQLKFFG